MSRDVKKLKEEIKKLDERLAGITVLDYDNRMIILASRNSKAREYNRLKKFWQLEISRIS